MSIAHSPCLWCQSLAMGSDSSSGHNALESSFVEFHFLPTWGGVLGGALGGIAVMHCRSRGRIPASSAAVAAFRYLAACLLAAMLVAISTVMLAFLMALLCFAASLLASMRAN